MSIIERRVWLATHKAPEGMMLVDVQEMDVMKRVVESQQERMAADHQILQRLIDVIEKARQIADPAEAMKYLNEELEKP